MIDEGALRVALRRAAAGAGASAGGAGDFAVRVDHRIAVLERRAARNRWALVGALATFVVVSGTLAYAVGRDGSTPEMVPATPTPRTGVPGWAPMAAAPIGPRSDHHQVWTGTELIVFGGYGGLDSERLRGMAAYDPAAGTWRTLAQPPELRSEHALWAGDQMLVLNVHAELYGYDPATDDWRALTPSPIAGENRLMAWVPMGDVVLAVYKTSGGRAPVLVYDPGADSWHGFPDVPVELGSIELHWTGDRVLALGHSGGDERSFPRLEAWSIDPATGAWTELPRPPLVDADRRYQTFSAWTGTELVVGGGIHLTDAAVAAIAAHSSEPDLTAVQRAAMQPRSARDAAAYDPVAGTWRTLPDAPVPVVGLAFDEPEHWTGREVLAWATADPQPLDPSDGRPVLLDPATGEWRVADAAPEGLRQGAPTTWTGHEVLWWSGEPSVGDTMPSVCCLPAVPTGSSFTP